MALRAQADGLALGAGVRFAGLQPPPTVARYLAAADALVIPGTVSGRNASPLKMFEYMAMHRPIVAVDLASLREILGDDGALYVPAGEAAALADALLTLAADPAQAEELGRRAGERAGGYTYAARARAVLAEMALAMNGDAVMHETQGQTTSQVGPTSRATTGAQPEASERRALAALMQLALAACIA